MGRSAAAAEPGRRDHPVLATGADLPQRPRSSTPCTRASHPAAGSRSTGPARAPRARSRATPGCLRHHPVVTGVRALSRADYGITGTRHRTHPGRTAGWTSTTSCCPTSGTPRCTRAANRCTVADEPVADDVHGNEIELADLYDGLRPRPTRSSSRRTHRHPRHDRRAGHGADDDRGRGAVGRPRPAGRPRAHDAHPHRRPRPPLPARHRARPRQRRARHPRREPGRTDRQRRRGPDAPDVHAVAGPAHLARRRHPAGREPHPGGTGRRGALARGRQPRGPRPARAGVRHRHHRDGRTTVTFGDGVHGARLPTGHENVRARYRFGIGRAANVKARPDHPAHHPARSASPRSPTRCPRRAAPTPTDRDPTRRGDPARRLRPRPAGLGARLRGLRPLPGRHRPGRWHVELFDGTTAGAACDGRRASTTSRSPRTPTCRGPCAPHSPQYGDPRLPVRVDVRELVLLLVVAAKVKVAPRPHAGTVVEPRLRQALLRPTRLRRAGVGPARPPLRGAGHRPRGAGRRLRRRRRLHRRTRRLTPAGLDVLAEQLTSPQPAVEARPRHVRRGHPPRGATDGETLTAVAARHGITLAELLRLNPDITDTRPLAKGRSVYVFRGIRPAQLALLSPRPRTPV